MKSSSAVRAFAWARWLALLAAFAAAGASQGAGSAALYSSVQTAYTGIAPVSQTFTPTSAQAGPVQVTITDTAFPAALAALYVAVTQGTTVVTAGTATAGAPATVTLNFTATAGTGYAIRVLGAPSTATGSGAVIVDVAGAGNPTVSYLSFPAAFQAPVTPGNGGILPSQTLTFPAAGTYTATLTDFGLPTSFPAGQLTAAIFQGATLVTPINPGTPAQFTVPAGNVGVPYTLTTIAVPATGGGLFGLQIASPSGALVYPTNGASGMTAIGGVTGPVQVPVTAAGSLALNVTDFEFPDPLGTLGAILTTTSGTLVATNCVTTCSAPNSPMATIAAPEYLLLWRAVAAGTGAGSYLISVTDAGATVYSDSESVAAPNSNSSTKAFTFPFTVPAAGSYTAKVTDLLAPAPLASVQFAVYQNGTLTSAQSTSAGSITFTAAAGGAQLVVVAAAQTGGSGIFGAQVLTTGSSPSSLLAISQAVGVFTGTQSLPVISSQAGQYDITLTDSAWPAPFQTLSLFVTSGAGIVSEIYTGGTVSVNLPAGNYLLTYSAVPDATIGAGLYGISVDAAVPTVSLSADPTSVASGSGTRLTWSSTGANACAASGAWSGTQPTSGASVAEGPLSSTATFTLTCSGPGGTSAPASVTIDVTPGSGGGGGGGGGMGALEVALLLLLYCARRAGLSSERARRYVVQYKQYLRILI